MSLHQWLVIRVRSAVGGRDEADEQQDRKRSDGKTETLGRGKAGGVDAIRCSESGEKERGGREKNKRDDYIA